MGGLDAARYELTVRHDSTARQYLALAHATFAPAVGTQARVPVSLNAAGRRLLGEFYELPAQLTLSGTAAASNTITFAYAKLKDPVGYTFGYHQTYTSVPEFAMTGLLPHSHVDVRCRGGGRPSTSHAAAQGISHLHRPIWRHAPACRRHHPSHRHRPGHHRCL